MTKILYGQLLDYTADPAIEGEAAIRHETRGAIVIDKKGKIAWRGPQDTLPEQYADANYTDHGEMLILPGFVDAHLHFPQCRMLAAYGKDLLDWLNRYTFIEEQRYGSDEIAVQAAGFFIDQLIENGITACLAFSTIHPNALDRLLEAASVLNMAIASGKTLMDRNAPPGLCDTPQSAYDESKALIERWHGKGRVRYAISPRFAITSSEAQLEAAGTLASEHPDLLIQTHLSENHAEIAFVAELFPEARDYTDIYDRYGLLTPNSLFAHGIHLSDRELSRLSEAGSAIVHCPTSNNFLGSGLMKLKATQKAGVKVGVGCDIGGGMSYSMFDTLRDAYAVSQHVGARVSAHDAFYIATSGNASLLKAEGEIGSLEPGKMADLVVLDPQATPLLAARHALSESLHDILFALMILGDDRAVAQTYIAGKPLKITD